jgi:hypothetical protein
LASSVASLGLIVLLLCWVSPIDSAAPIAIGAALLAAGTTAALLSRGGRG